MNIYNSKCSTVITKQLKDKKTNCSHDVIIYLNKWNGFKCAIISWSVDLLRKELGQTYNISFDWLSLSTFHSPSSVMTNQLIYFYTVCI